MSNIGINIWTTGPALQNPELSGVPTNNASVALDVPPSLITSDVAGLAGVLIDIPLSVSSAQQNTGSVSTSFSASMFTGDVEGGVSVLVPAAVESGSVSTPNIQGVAISILPELNISGYTPNRGGVDVTTEAAMFSGNIVGGGANLITIGPVQIETFASSVEFTNGLILLPGLTVDLPVIETILDNAWIQDEAFEQTMVVLNEHLQIAAHPASSLLRGHVLAYDQVAIQALAIVPIIADVLEELEINDSGSGVTAYKLVNVLSDAGIFDTPESTATLIVAIAQTLVLSDFTRAIQVLTLQDAADLLVSSASSFRATVQAVDALVATSSTSASALLTIAVKDSSSLDDEVLSTGWLQSAVEDGLEVFAALQVGEDVFHGWVVNTRNSAFSEYTNYKFNSLLELDGRYFGVATDGLYELTGDDDASVPIEASIKTGLLDLGSHYLKDAKAVHLGYTSSGKLVLKVTTTAKGQKEEWWYELKHSAAQSLRDGRFTIGRGLRAKYWQFELVNVDGADFEIDDVQLMYNVLSRRIR